MDSFCGRNSHIEELFRDHYGPLTGYLYRLLQNREEARDIAQEAFLRAMAQEGFGGQTFQSRQWLYRVATNLAFSLGRRIKRSIRAMSGMAVDTERLVVPGVEASLARRQELEGLFKGLKSLDNKTRSAILLRYFESMSCQEISEILEVPPGTVMTWLHRGREKLKFFVEGKGLAGADVPNGQWEEEDAVPSS